MEKTISYYTVLENSITDKDRMMVTNQVFDTAAEATHYAKQNKPAGTCIEIERVIIYEDREPGTISRKTVKSFTLLKD